jgi:hypothetical protein
VGTNQRRKEEMKERTEINLEWLSAWSMGWIIMAIAVLLISAGLSFIDPRFWLLTMLEAIPGIAMLLVVTDGCDADLMYTWDFHDFNDGEHAIKIIEYEGKYHRAVYFMGVYLRESKGYASVADLMDYNKKEEKVENKCTVIGDLS